MCFYCSLAHCHNVFNCLCKAPRVTLLLNSPIQIKLLDLLCHTQSVSLNLFFFLNSFMVWSLLKKDLDNFDCNKQKFSFYVK